MKLHEFADSIEEFRKRHAVERAKALRAVREYARDKAIENQADKMSAPGIAIGGLAGAALGSGSRRVGAFGGAAIGGALGMLGLRAAGRMDERRRILAVKEKMEAGKNLSANLKPALRELAAISEGLKEFAMVRDESGRYVEVPEVQGGESTALNGLAGLAAVGGAYKGHQAVMNKFSGGARQAGFNGVKEAYGNAGKAAWNATSGAASGAVGAAKGGLRGGLLKLARALKPARI